ncbi:unnamed protein product [Protopolystoma xenopodis]|uniref:Uncharacterized protein n=1 Tax=Protopolystoma xenopodis TaxID=117903 RepID=A0A3S5BNC8_9PLAT|nr:unnamed protein product [Protopolystoma xenopodis]
MVQHGCIRVALRCTIAAKQSSFSYLLLAYLNDIKGNVVGAEIGGPQGRRKHEPGHTVTDYERFIDLVQRMLVYDPKHRIRPEEALAHRFFQRRDDGQLIALFLQFNHLLYCVCHFDLVCATWSERQGDLIEPSEHWLGTFPYVSPASSIRDVIVSTELQLIKVASEGNPLDQYSVQPLLHHSSPIFFVLPSNAAPLSLNLTS